MSRYAKPKMGSRRARTAHLLACLRDCCCSPRRAFLLPGRMFARFQREPGRFPTLSRYGAGPLRRWKRGLGGRR